MNSSPLHQIQQVLDEKTLGIVWITSGQFNETVPELDSFDYLFDGLLGQRLQQDISSLSAPHIFLTQSFGRPLFLCQLSKAQENWKKTLQETLKILLTKNNMGERNHLVIKTPSAIGMEAEIKKLLENNLDRSLVLNFCH